ncbi:MAG TPA: antibiotic biosynthesis monooxygenase [Sphingobium sp.]|nr:antibiotic biosynthesis monooxygenase [Sphingobium sp.]
MTGSIPKLPPRDAVAVIFISLRTDEDVAGYDAAAGAMAMLAARQPGYLGVDSVRGADGVGITVSYWADEASALAWRGEAEHEAVRALGQARWYAHYRLIVSRVTRAYEWRRPGPGAK